MGHMSPETQQLVVNLATLEKLGPVAISHRLKQVHINIGRKSIAKFLRHYQETKTTAPKERQPVKSKLDSYASLIDKAYKQDDELSTSKLQKILAELYDVKVS